MTDQQVKPQLRRTVEAAQDEERVLAELCDDTPAGVDGRWTAKDHVAHLSAWREHAARVLDAALRGEDQLEDFDIDTRTRASTPGIAISQRGTCWRRLKRRTTNCSPPSTRRRKRCCSATGRAGLVRCGESCPATDMPISVST